MRWAETEAVDPEVTKKGEAHMKNLNNDKLLRIFWCFGILALSLVNGAHAQDDNTIVRGHETIVGRISDTEREAVETVTDGDIVTVGKRSDSASMNTFLQKVPTTIILMVEPSDAYRIVEPEMIKIAKDFDFVKSVKWDKNKSSITLVIDTQNISAEAAGRKVAMAIRSKFNIRYIEGAVRR